MKIKHALLVVCIILQLITLSKLQTSKDQSWIYEVKLEDKSTEKELGNGWSLETSESGHLNIVFKKKVIFKLSEDMAEYNLKPTEPFRDTFPKATYSVGSGYPLGVTTGVQLYVDYNNGQVNCIEPNGGRYGIRQ